MHDQRTDKPSYICTFHRVAWMHLKTRNLCQVQFTILFNHSKNYVNKNLPIFNNIKAQIRETYNFGYQRQYTFLSIQNSWIQKDRQIDKQQDGQTVRNEKQQRVTDNDKTRQTVWHWQTKANFIRKQNSWIETDRQIDKHTDSKTFRQIKRQTDRQSGRQW